MNNQVRLLLAILPALTLSPLAGNSEKISKSIAPATRPRLAEKSGSTSALYLYNVINDRADTGKARISADWPKPKAGALLIQPSGQHAEAQTSPEVHGDQTLEVPRISDPKPSDSDDELSATWQHDDGDLQLGPASGERQSFPAIARPIGTIRDYENEAKSRTAATDCIASQWWWTSGVADCMPTRSPGSASYRRP